jgi:hypothetical protein
MKSNTDDDGGRKTSRSQWWEWLGTATQSRMMTKKKNGDGNEFSD